MEMCSASIRKGWPCQSRLSRFPCIPGLGISLPNAPAFTLQAAIRLYLGERAEMMVRDYIVTLAAEDLVKITE